MKNRSKNLRTKGLCKWGNQLTIIIEVLGQGPFSFRGTKIDECCQSESRENHEIPSTTEDYNDDKK